MIYCFGVIGNWYLTMSEDGDARFREPETVYEERELVVKAIPS